MLGVCWDDSFSQRAEAFVFRVWSRTALMTCLWSACRCYRWSVWGPRVCRRSFQQRGEDSSVMHTYHVPESNLYFTVSTQLNLWSETRTEKKKSFKWKSGTSYIFFKVLRHPFINYSANPSSTDNHSANMHLHKLLNGVQIFGPQEKHENMRISWEFPSATLHRPIFIQGIFIYCTWCQTHINHSHK